MLLEKFHIVDDPRDYEPNDFFKHSSFKSICLKSIDDETIGNIISLFQGVEVGDEMYRSLRKIIGKRKIIEIFGLYNKHISQDERPNFSLIILGEMYETLFAQTLFRSRLNTLINNQQLGDNYTILSSFNVEGFGVHSLFAPISKDGFYFLHSELEEDFICGDREVETEDGKYIVFNNQEKGFFHLYNVEKDQFRTVEGLCVASRNGIPDNILEICRNDRSLFFDLSTELCFSKKHSTHHHKVHHIYEFSDDNLAVHGNLDVETRIDKSNPNSRGEYEESVYQFWVSEIYSMTGGCNIYSYNGEIVDIIELGNGRKYVLGETLKCGESVRQLIDLHNHKVIYETNTDINYTEYLKDADRIIIVSHYRDKIIVKLGVGKEDILECKDIQDVHNYNFNGVQYLGFTIIHRDGEKEYYASHLKREDQKLISEHTPKQVTSDVAMNEDIDLPENLSGMYIAPKSLSAIPEFQFNPETENDNSSFSVKSYARKLSGQQRAERFLARLYDDNKKIHHGESLRMIKDLVKYEVIPEQILDCIIEIVSKVGLSEAIKNFLLLQGISILSHKPSFRLDPSDDLILRYGNTILHSNFGNVSCTNYTTVGSKDDEYIGNIKFKTGTFVIKLTGDSFEYCQILPGEKNIISVGGKKLQALENPVKGLDFICDRTNTVYQIGFTQIVTDRGIIDEQLDEEIDVRMKKDRIILFLDDSQDHYVIFDGSTISEIYKTRPLMGFKVTKIRKESIPILH